MQNIESKAIRQHYSPCHFKANPANIHANSAEPCDKHANNLKAYTQANWNYIRKRTEIKKESNSRTISHTENNFFRRIYYFHDQAVCLQDNAIPQPGRTEDRGGKTTKIIDAVQTFINIYLTTFINKNIIYELYLPYTTLNFEM